MNSPKPSASTPPFASTALPAAEVIPIKVTRRQSPKRGAFTKSTVAKMYCSTGTQEALFWDASCRGFGLRSLASGRRTWIFQYRDEHKRTRRIALGDVSAVSLEIARQSARQHAARVVQGGNPSAERKAKKSAASVLNVIEGYLRYAKTRQRLRSYKEIERHLLTHAAALHHDKAVAVRRSDIAVLLDRVSSDSGPFAANRLRAALSALWSWGMRVALIESDVNPVTFTLRHPEKPRERNLSDDELKAIWAATDKGGAYACIVRLCLLTGCRRDEIGGLRWDEVLGDRFLIGANRMKGGKIHEVPLLPAIAATLPEKPANASSSVFGRRGTGFSGWSKSKVLLDKKIVTSGVMMPRWTLHDLRRAFSTRLHDAGVEPLAVEALLAHKQQGVAAVYNRASFWQQKCTALQHWHELLLGLLGVELVELPTEGRCAFQARVTFESCNFLILVQPTGYFRVTY